MALDNTSLIEGESIGIDLGTSYCRVGVWRNKRVEIIVNDQGLRATPACVAFAGARPLIGQTATYQGVVEDVDTVFDTKRLIGGHYDDLATQADMKHWPFQVIAGPGRKPLISVRSGGVQKTFAPEEISAMVLMEMKKLAEVHIGRDVRSAIITVPAGFNYSQRQGTVDAAAIAGLVVLRVGVEPTIAALGSNPMMRTGPRRSVLVFSLGGGTTGVSLLDVEWDVFEVKAAGGDTHLGGQDFTNCMVDYCMSELRQRYRRDLSTDRRALRRLWAACERAKRTLSYKLLAHIEISSLSKSFDYRTTITRAQFEEMNMDNFNKCMRVMETVLSQAPPDRSQVHEVVPVGGSTRIPRIQHMLRHFLGGRELSPVDNRDEAAINGATMQAAILGTTDGPVALEDLLLLDVIPMTLGVATAAGECLGLEGDNLVMTAILKRNTTFPAAKTQRFHTLRDNQTNVSIRVFAGEHVGVFYNSFGGHILLDGLPPKPRGQLALTIDVTFDFDPTGILHVHAKETSTGQGKSIKVTRWLTQDEAKRMAEDARCC